MGQFSKSPWLWIAASVVLSWPALAAPQSDPGSGVIRFHNRTAAVPDADYVPIHFHELSASYLAARAGKPDDAKLETDASGNQGRTLHGSPVTVETSITTEEPPPTATETKKARTSLLQTKGDKNKDDAARATDPARVILRSSKLFPQEKDEATAGEGWLAAAIELQKQEAAGTDATPGTRARTDQSYGNIGELPNADSYETTPVAEDKPTSLFDRSQPDFPNPYAGASPSYSGLKASSGIQPTRSTPAFGIGTAPQIDFNQNSPGSLVPNTKDRKTDILGQKAQ